MENEQEKKKAGGNWRDHSIQFFFSVIFDVKYLVKSPFLIKLIFARYKYNNLDWTYGNMKHSNKQWINFFL